MLKVGVAITQHITVFEDRALKRLLRLNKFIQVDLESI
jgi:hypothetical protein